MEEMTLTISEARSGQFLRNDYKGALAKFGVGFTAFTAEYPRLQKRTRLYADPVDAVRKNAPALSVVDRIYGNGASVFWLKYMLIELFTYLGAIDSVTVFQVRMLAKQIRSRYYHMTTEELSTFFYLFTMGDYGKLYAGRTVNPQDILIALKSYSFDLFDARAKISNEQKQAEIERMLNDPRNMSYEEYLVIKQMTDEYAMLTRAEEEQLKRKNNENHQANNHI